MSKVLVGLVQRLLQRDDTQLKLLLLFTLIATVGFAFPRLDWVTYIGYTLVALLLTQVMVGSSKAPDWSDALYRGLGLMAVVTMWLWLLTPLELIYSGMPLALSWSVLVAWSVIRLVTRFASTRRVTEALLMGATAGYLHIGLAAGLVMSALETIQPGSFQPLEMTNVGDSSVLANARIFSALNYYAFVCLTTVGFGDISPMLPLSRMVSVATSVAGPLYLAAVIRAGSAELAAVAPTQQPVVAHGLALMPLPLQHLIHGAEVQISKGGAGRQAPHQLRSHHCHDLLNTALPNRRGRQLRIALPKHLVATPFRQGIHQLHRFTG